MVGSRRMVVRPKRNAQKGAADGSRAPRTPRRPTAGRPLASTQRQKDAKRVAEGGRVPAVVRHRMTPRGRSLIPVDEEDESDEDVHGDPTALTPVGLEFRTRSLNRGLGHHCVAPEF